MNPKRDRATPHYLTLFFLTAALLCCAVSCSEDPAGPAANDDPPPDAPKLVAPLNGAQCNLPVLCEWQGNDRYSGYLLQVFNDSSSRFLQIHEIAATETSATLDSLEWNATYYWRIGGVYGGDTIWSETRSFLLPMPAAAQWKYCTVMIAGISANLRIVEKSTTDSTVSSTDELLGWTQAFTRDSGAVSVFTANVIIRSGLLSYTKWTVRAVFDLRGSILNSVDGMETVRDERYSGPVQSSSVQRRGFAFSGLELAQSSKGVYQIDDSALLSRFDYTWYYHASFSPRTGSDTWVEKKPTGFNFENGAVVRLTFR